MKFGSFFVDGDVSGRLREEGFRDHGKFISNEVAFCFPETLQLGLGFVTHFGTRAFRYPHQAVRHRLGY
jgi:hypothetical protein